MRQAVVSIRNSAARRKKQPYHNSKLHIEAFDIKASVYLYHRLKQKKFETPKQRTYIFLYRD